MKRFFLLFAGVLTIPAVSFSQLNSETAPRVTTAQGILEGTYHSGIKIFKGVPFAAPPVGNLRWREPQPPAPWTGIRKADKFGPRAMQLPIFSDMNFRSDGVSEDCLYLNVWTPAKTATEGLPVLVYFYGGGFRAGDGSEYRYDGESMSRKGIIAITVNYRLSVFGFFAHPELTKESPHHASGNYGLLDQAAALQWVQKNIAAFGGDPKRITIAGESAGSFSVSAQMASPLSKNIIAGAIGESGSLLGLNPPAPLADVEKAGLQFAESLGAKTLAELRALPAQQVLEAAEKRGAPRFPVVVDGWFFQEPPATTFAKGAQAHVPLLVGWNTEENNYRAIMNGAKPTLENYTKAVQANFGNKSADVLAAYHAGSDAEVEAIATQFASDMFIGYGTWKWGEMQAATGGKPVYRYLYGRARPLSNKETAKYMMMDGGQDSLAAAISQTALRGANHSAEIEYAMGNLSTNRVYNWQPEDFLVSQVMQDYFANFIKKGDPNGSALPTWPAVKKDAVTVMYINADTKAGPEKNRKGYLYFDSMQQQQK